MQIFIAAIHTCQGVWCRVALSFVVTLACIGHVEGAEVPKLISVVAAPESLNQFNVALSHEPCTNELACGGDATIPANWFIISDDGGSSLGIQSVNVEGTNVLLVSSLARITARIYRVGVATNGFGVFDVSGTAITPGSYVRTVASFQQGFGGYTDTQDTFLDSVNPDVPQGASNKVSVAQGRSTVTRPILHGLLRFDNLFGSSENQISYAAVVKRAVLFLANETYDDTSSSFIPVHRVRADWNQRSATWNSLVNGIGYISYDPNEVDPSELEPVMDSSTQSGLFISDFPWIVAIDVTTSLRAWESGSPNRGWALIPRNDDSSLNRFGFASSEHEIAAYRPRLEVDFVVPRLRVRSEGNQRILEWEDASFVLQSSVSLNPPDWKLVEGASAGEYIVPINDTQRFFRLCSGCP